MPKLLFKKEYLAYMGCLLTSLFIMLLVKFNLTYFFENGNVWPEGKEIDKLTVNYSVDMMIGELYVVTFVTAFKITIDWLREHKRLADLEKAKLETELLFLRSQVSPHFFFNTLNNCYSLALINSPKTPKIILKLSELMRYLLSETTKRRQSLINEIMCIENYLDLERLRFNHFLEIDLKISGDIQDKEIAPLLLLTFIENAFKHGANKNIGKIKISINFKVIEDFLYFSITNPMPTHSTYKQELNTTGGIGLKNIKKRLELGYKKEDYNLLIKEIDNSFVVKLKIKVRWS